MPDSEKLIPPPGTYVIHISKDQVYRVPPPENAHLYEDLACCKSHRRPYCLCIC
jgi:hypothetical protein